MGGAIRGGDLGHLVVHDAHALFDQFDQRRTLFGAANGGGLFIALD